MASESDPKGESGGLQIETLTTSVSVPEFIVSQEYKLFSGLLKNRRRMEQGHAEIIEADAVFEKGHQIPCRRNSTSFHENVP